MKYIRSLVAFAAVAFTAYTSQAVTPSPVLGPVIFKIATLSEIQVPTTGKTNSTSTSTNITQNIKVNGAKTNLTSTTLLHMVENSLNTTFPSGAALQLDSDFNIVIAVGTNIVATTTNVFTLLTTNEVQITTGAATTKETISASGESSQTTEKAVETKPAVLKYDDSTLVTANGINTQFTVFGILTARLNASLNNTVEKVSGSVSFVGSGSGSIGSTDIIAQGGFTGRVSVTQSTP